MHARVCPVITLFCFFFASCNFNDDPHASLSGRSFSEAEYSFRTTTDWFPNFEYLDSTYLFDSSTEEYYLALVTGGEYSVNGDTLRFHDSEIVFQSHDCSMTSGDYKQSDYTLFSIENNQLYLNYNYILEPVAHAGESLNGRWEYSHRIATRRQADVISETGLRTYYFIFSESSQIYEFGWQDNFNSCFGTNLRHNGYRYTAPLLDMKPLPVHPNFVTVDFRNGKMYWSDANGFVGFRFTKR